MRVAAALLVTLALAVSTRGGDDHRPLTTGAACAVLINAYPAGLLHHADETVKGARPWCEKSASSTKRYVVLGLHSDRRCNYMCSSLVGWFAVDRTTRRIFDWDGDEGAVARIRWDGERWID